MDAKHMYPDGFHPIAMDKPPDISYDKARYINRSDCDVTYYFSNLNDCVWHDGPLHSLPDAVKREMQFDISAFVKILNISYKHCAGASGIRAFIRRMDILKTWRKDLGNAESVRLELRTARLSLRVRWFSNWSLW